MAPAPHRSGPCWLRPRHPLIHSRVRFCVRSCFFRTASMDACMRTLTVFHTIPAAAGPPRWRFGEGEDRSFDGAKLGQKAEPVPIHVLCSNQLHRKALHTHFPFSAEGWLWADAEYSHYLYFMIYSVTSLGNTPEDKHLDNRLSSVLNTGARQSVSAVSDFLTVCPRPGQMQLAMACAAVWLAVKSADLEYLSWLWQSRKY